MRSLVLLVAVLAVVCVARVAAYTPAALADQITSLPGLDASKVGFNQFSGYLNVDSVKNRNIFYWYVESAGNPSTDPLIWWSNGGPGCSGLLGLLTEHGPFRTNAKGGLDPYPHAWNQIANVLYVEAPAGVGFSFSDDAADYTTNDTLTANDNYAAIQAFFQKFPERRANDFYISAESYGGHYVPELAQTILKRQAGHVASANGLNFKGFLLGNPLTDMDENMYWGQAGTLCGHSMASRPACDALQKHCLGDGGMDNACDAAQSEVVSQAGGLIDLYGLDFPTCSSAAVVARHTLRHLYSQQMRKPGFNPQLKAKLTKLGDWDPTYDPCGDNEETTYLNRADVRSALHVSPKANQWAMCSNVVNYDQSNLYIRMEPIYHDLIAHGGLRMVIMSGDDDSICATTGTQHWMFNEFAKDVVQGWTAWTYDSERYGQQLGGYTVKFKGVTLATVHGAGHMISQYQPERGFAVLKQFLAGAFDAQPAKQHGKQHIALE